LDLFLDVRRIDDQLRQTTFLGWRDDKKAKHGFSASALLGF
jgi:hypothetical protein